jgi:signal peptidase I
MGKRWLFLIIPVSVLLIGFIVARLTGVFQIYKIPTPSSEPTIKVGSIVFTSNLKSPVPGDIVAYKSEYVDSLNPYLKPGEIHLHRMVASEGDIVEMKAAVLYINGENFDADKNLLNEYIIDKRAVDFLTNAKEMEEKGMLFMNTTDSIRIFLSFQQATELASKGITARKNVVSVEYNLLDGNGAFAWYKKDSVWSIDHFGPIKIPEGFFFVIGDNRHNSLDSRYVGFIKKENFRGTVLNIQ